MLTPDQLEHVSDDAVKLYAELEETIVRDIARRIITSGVMTETARHQIKAIQESGKLYEEVIEEIARITKQSKSTIKKIFEDAVIQSLKFDDDVYKKAGFNPLPMKQSPSMLQTLVAGLNKTNGDIHNLIMTTAGSAQNAFINATNMAYEQVVSGAFDYNTAIFNAIEKVSKDGINVVYPSGRQDKIDVAIRRAVLTGVNQTANNIQDQRADEMDCDLVEVTAHVGARVTKKLDWTNHSWWQGKVYSRSGTSKKYPGLKEVTGYGKVDGLGGINCRHNKFPFIEGVSQRAYTDEELEQMNNRTVTYKGQEIQEYEATQMQRAKERKIRQIKRELAVYEETMLNGTNDELVAQARGRFNKKAHDLKQAERELKDFSTQTGLKRDKARERVYGFDRGFSNRVINADKDFKKQQEYDIIVKEIKSHNIRGTVNLDPEEIDIDSLTFDDKHVNKERKHNVSETEAKQFIREAKISVTRWNGKFINYYGENGATYINTETNEIRTSFKIDEFTENIKEALEVLKKYGR